MAGVKSTRSRRKLRPDDGGAQGSALQKDKIIESIALEITQGTWRPFRSVRELAARLDIPLSRAMHYAGEATRLLRMAWGGEEAKAAILERIAEIGIASETRTEEVVDMKGNIRTVRRPDMRSALAAAQTVANALGLTGSNSEVVIRYQQMTDSDLLREVQRLSLLESKKPDARTIESDGQEVSPEPNPGRELAKRLSPNRGPFAMDSVDPKDAGGGRGSGV